MTHRSSSRDTPVELGCSHTAANCDWMSLSQNRQKRGFLVEFIVLPVFSKAERLWFPNQHLWGSHRHVYLVWEWLPYSTAFSSMIVRFQHKTSSINCKWHGAFVVVAQALHTCLTLSSLYICAYMRVFVYHFTSSSKTILYSWVFALLLPTVTECLSKVLCQAIARVRILHPCVV